MQSSLKYGIYQKMIRHFSRHFLLKNNHYCWSISKKAFHSKLGTPRSCDLDFSVVFNKSLPQYTGQTQSCDLDCWSSLRIHATTRSFRDPISSLNHQGLSPYTRPREHTTTIWINIPPLMWRTQSPRSFSDINIPGKQVSIFTNGCKKWSHHENGA